MKVGLSCLCSILFISLVTYSCIYFYFLILLKKIQTLDLASKPPTPKALKKTSKNLSTSSLYASSPTLSLQQDSNTCEVENEVPKRSSISTNRLKSLRDFFRNTFNLNNKTGNKASKIVSPVIVAPQTLGKKANIVDSSEATRSITVLDTDEK